MALHSLSFDAIGTHWVIDLSDFPEHQYRHIVGTVQDRISAFDQVYSRFKPDSLITQISQSPGEYLFPSDSISLFSLYRQLYDLTDGAFTPLVGQTLVQSGYDADYSLSAQDTLTPVPAWDDVMSFFQGKLTTNQPLLLDFGAAGKGYLVDLVSQLLRSFQVGSYTVDAGGDIAHFDHSRHLRVGLEHPQNPDQVIGVVDLNNRSICGSSGNRRRWQHYNHIFDVRQLKSVDHLLAVWVVADTTAVADGLTTALCFSDPSRLAAQFDFEYFMLYPDYSFQKSPNFPAELFIQ